MIGSSTLTLTLCLILKNGGQFACNDYKCLPAGAKVERTEKKELALALKASKDTALED